MAKKSGRKKRKRDAKASGRPLDIATVEGALEAALEREAKLASRLEATRTEVATLRLVLADMLPLPEVAPALPPAPGVPARKPPRAKAPAAKPSVPAPKAPASRTRRATPPVGGAGS
jgi:hypothetical protein